MRFFFSAGDFSAFFCGFFGIASEFKSFPCLGRGFLKVFCRHTDFVTRRHLPMAPLVFVFVFPFCLVFLQHLHSPFSAGLRRFVFFFVAGETHAF